MELRILFLSLLPTVALAGALAAGAVDDETRPRDAELAARIGEIRVGEATRVGTTVVTAARPLGASLAALEASAP
jgi:hypothetical protein